MYADQKERLEVRAGVLKAMAHPVRLFVIEALAGGERNVQELTAAIGMDMSTVSRHLSVLRNTGIVDCEKRGNRVFYRLHVPCVLRFFTCVEQFLQSRARKRSRGLP